MAKLVDLDLFGAASLNTEVDIRHPAHQPFMMAFVNIASNASVLTVAEEGRLRAALGLLADNLHDRGTIVVALQDWNFNYDRLQGDFCTEESIRAGAARNNLSRASHGLLRTPIASMTCASFLC